MKKDTKMKKVHIYIGFEPFEENIEMTEEQYEEICGYESEYDRFLLLEEEFGITMLPYHMNCFEFSIQEIKNLCVFCKRNTVNTDDGYDTCQSCLNKM